MSIPNTEWVQGKDGWSLRDSTGSTKADLGSVSFNEGNYSAQGHDSTFLGTFSTLHEAQQEVENYLQEFI